MALYDQQHKISNIVLYMNKVESYVALNMIIKINFIDTGKMPTVNYWVGKSRHQICMIPFYRKCAPMWVYACESEWYLLTHPKMLTGYSVRLKVTFKFLLICLDSV